MASGSATFEPRDEKRLLGCRLEPADDLAFTATKTLCGGETGARQLLEAPFSLSHGLGISRIELVSAIAAVIHHNLNAHSVLLLFGGLIRPGRPRFQLYVGSLRLATEEAMAVRARPVRL
jgi:hypothetical protein